MPAPAASDGGNDGRAHRSPQSDTSTFQPLTQVTGLNGDVYASFDHLIFLHTEAASSVPVSNVPSVPYGHGTFVTNGTGTPYVLLYSANI